jgi:hypothetical protein
MQSDCCLGCWQLGGAQAEPLVPGWKNSDEESLRLWEGLDASRVEVQLGVALKPPLSQLELAKDLSTLLEHNPLVSLGFYGSHSSLTTGLPSNLGLREARGMTAALPIEFLCAFPLWEIRFGALGIVSASPPRKHCRPRSSVGTGNDQRGFGWAGLYWQYLPLIRGIEGRSRSEPSFFADGTSRADPAGVAVQSRTRFLLD